MFKKIAFSSLLVSLVLLTSFVIASTDTIYRIESSSYVNPNEVISEPVLSSIDFRDMDLEYDRKIIVLTIRYYDRSSNILYTYVESRIYDMEGNAINTSIWFLIHETGEVVQYYMDNLLD